MAPRGRAVLAYQRGVGGTVALGPLPQELQPLSTTQLQGEQRLELGALNRAQQDHGL